MQGLFISLVVPGKVPLPETLTENPQRLERFLAVRQIVMSHDVGQPNKVE